MRSGTSGQRAARAGPRPLRRARRACSRSRWEARGARGATTARGEQDSARGAGRAGVALRARVASLLPRAEYQVAQLNGAGVRALWAARGLERAWLGGEEEGGEEEPYSLTASAVLLRRLSAEAAPPPLGRPVFEATFLARAID